jgi:hypothetical protein
LTPPYSEEGASRFEFVSTEAVDPEKQYANWSSGTIAPFLNNQQQHYQAIKKANMATNRFRTIVGSNRVKAQISLINGSPYLLLII